MIRLVLFDWGGVLTDGEYDRQVARDLAARTGLPEADIYKAWRDGKRVAWERGESDLDEVWDELVRRFSLKGTSADFTALLRNAIDPNPRVIDLLAPLRTRAALGLLSNNYPAVSPFVKKSVGALFDRLFFSDETGVVKPDPEAYRIALEAFGIPPEETLFVDDKEKNLPVPRSLNMAVHRYMNAPALRAELVARELLVS
jgi:HAD superfamily hydrolase (TIGR01509 family)